MILLSCVRQLAVQLVVYWLVPDSEAVVGALCTYQEQATVGMAYTIRMPRSWGATVLSPPER